MDPGLSQRTKKTLQELVPAFAASAPPPPQAGHLPIDLSRALNETIHPELLEFFKSTVEDSVTSEVRKLHIYVWCLRQMSCFVTNVF